VLNPGGGAIYNGGLLTLSGCTLTGNTGGQSGGLVAGSGGAIYNRGTMIINNSVVSNNWGFSPGGGTSVDGGGAIENFGSLTINGGSLSGNTSDEQGGAIFNRFGSVWSSKAVPCPAIPRSGVRTKSKTALAAVSPTLAGP
jgi:hypothetical protein